uniref:hypothetical protein n=1 Tax=Pseudonocardia sp. CA-138482 TaxID=3240023 RepID=UPI003F494070
MSSTPERRRAYSELPEDLAEHLKRYAAINGTTVAEMCYHWVVMAANLAAMGLGKLLPQERRAPRDSVGPTRVVRWMQGEAEERRCRAQIEGAGSSIAAVLREAGWSLVEADGDVVMIWPLKRDNSQVA